MKTIARWAGMLALALFLIVPLSTAKAIDLYRDQAGMPGSFVQGLRDTYGLSYFVMTYPDISSATSTFLISPISGRITRIDVVIATAITAANAYLSSSISGVGITGGTVTIDWSDESTGSQWSNGLRWSATPTTLNQVQKNDVISIGTAGASTTTSVGTITITIDRDGLVTGPVDGNNPF